MTLGTTNGNVTFKAADANGNAQNISLSGNLTGTGGLNKTGGGTLTLSGTGKHYSGGTAATAGTLATGATGAFGNRGRLREQRGHPHPGEQHLPGVVRQPDLRRLLVHPVQLQRLQTIGALIDSSTGVSIGTAATRPGSSTASSASPTSATRTASTAP